VKNPIAVASRDFSKVLKQNFGAVLPVLLWYFKNNLTDTKGQNDWYTNDDTRARMIVLENCQHDGGGDVRIVDRRKK